MNVAAQVASRVVDIVKNAWYGSGWSTGGGGGGSEGAHQASYTCLLASGYKAAYQELDHIKQAKLDGHSFVGDLSHSDPVMNLVEQAMADAIKELYPEYGKGYSSSPGDRQQLVMSFNDGYATHEMALAVAERAQEIIEHEARVAEWMRDAAKKQTLPSKFSFEADETDELAADIDDLLSESEERDYSALMEHAAEEKKKAPKKLLLEQ